MSPSDDDEELSLADWCSVSDLDEIATFSIYHVE